MIRFTRKLSGSKINSKVKELEMLREEQARQSEILSRGNDVFLRVCKIRDRVSKITRRNKKRSILVIELSKNENPLVSMLLEANPAATSNKVKSLSEAVAAHEGSPFDMVYLVFDGDSTVKGPCFFSTTHKADEDRREKHSSLSRRAETVSSLFSGAEIIVVCEARGSCEVSKALFDRSVE